MAFIRIVLGALILAFALSSQAEGNKVKETDWLSQSQLNNVFHQALDNRFMLFKVVGKKNEDDSISYKAFLKPYPVGLDRFFTYWGMSADRYQSRKSVLEEAGYKEIWHQSFVDAGGQDVHQAVWLKLQAAGAEKKTEPDRKSGKSLTS